MKDLDELDRLHAAATAGEWVVRSYQEPSGEFFPAPSWEVYDEDNLALTAALYAAWPSVSARLRAAEAENAKLRHHYDAAAPEHNLLAVLDLYEGRRLEAVAEVERLRGLVRWFLDGDDCAHEDDCGARGNHDLDVCRNTKPCADETCDGPHCTCEATMMRDRARVAQGEP